ncbi:hypothetical protein JNK13_01035 [bacterium]|nr:hypothetical protein [bacterium]
MDQNILERVANLETQVDKINNRNDRVEKDKLWEKSKTRLTAISLITYFVMVLVLRSLGVGQAFLNAIVPTSGFVLSTLSLPYIRKFWEKF